MNISEESVSIIEEIELIKSVEVTQEKIVFLVQVLNRNKEALLKIFNDHVLKGSIIFTDG